ncbi:hypothetical protein [Staphylococcus haemolyticus]|uniref:hypothetical protein n=1 Tax=Staphylococcus haemolyticus TaxID=1283 RepID=UPI001F0A4EC7|nr:hypothetical protein [Staphylococcus haemolyticus]MCH4501233.1 hypothetical protein [Staphylococcus haemolyticus]
MSKLYKVAYNQLYIAKANKTHDVDFKFTKDENEYTHMIINTYIDGTEHTKDIIITREAVLDDFDLEGINEILKTNNIKIKRLEEKVIV